MAGIGYGCPACSGHRCRPDIFGGLNMRRAIHETDRRRMMQIRYNEEHGITPETIVKDIQKKIVPESVEDRKKLAAAVEGLERAEVMELEKEMYAAAGEIREKYGV